MPNQSSNPQAFPKISTEESWANAGEGEFQAYGHVESFGGMLAEREKGGDIDG